MAPPQFRKASPRIGPLMKRDYRLYDLASVSFYSSPPSSCSYSSPLRQINTNINGPNSREPSIRPQVNSGISVSTNSDFDVPRLRALRVGFEPLRFLDLDHKNKNSDVCIVVVDTRVICD